MMSSATAQSSVPESGQRKKRPGIETELRTAKDRILQTSVKLLQRQGYHNTSIDQIISEAMVSKGNFFHHFKNKEELGYSVIESLRADHAKHLASLLAERSKNPVQRLFASLETIVRDPSMRRNGSPIGKLAQELSETHEGFRKKISEIFEMWISAVSRLFEEAKLMGGLRKDVDCRALAEFWVTHWEGLMLLAGSLPEQSLIENNLNELKGHLRSLGATSL